MIVGLESGDCEPLCLSTRVPYENSSLFFFVLGKRNVGNDVAPRCLRNFLDYHFKSFLLVAEKLQVFVI